MKGMRWAVFPVMFLSVLFSSQLSLGEPSSFATPIDLSEIHIPSAISCFHSLEKAAGSTMGYPPGFVAVAGKRAGKKGALLFDSQNAWFFEGMEPTVHGDYMEFWGESTDQFVSPLSEGKDAMSPSARGYLATLILQRMSLYFNGALEAKKTPAVVSSEAQASEPLSEEEQVLAARLVTEFSEFQNPASPALRTGESPSPPDTLNTRDAHAVEQDRRNQELLNAVDRSFEAFDQLGTERDLQVSADALIIALRECEKGIGRSEPRVSKKAEELRVELERIRSAPAPGRGNGAPPAATNSAQ